VHIIWGKNAAARLPELSWRISDHFPLWVEFHVG
jgi:endonuclease/exonuclease/phosphatase (EEP) superfamily protein YafD